MSVCERCKREMYRFETCDYCGRKICDACVKASQKATKLQRLVICRDDWNSLPKRTQYKNKQKPVLAAPNQKQKA